MQKFESVIKVKTKNGKLHTITTEFNTSRLSTFTRTFVGDTIGIPSQDIDEIWTEVKVDGKTFNPLQPLKL